MRNELKHIELIENYLLGKLNNDQKVAFEYEMQSDIKLQEEVDLQKSLMNRLSVIAFADDIKAFHPEYIIQEGKGGQFKWFLNGLLILTIVGAATLGIYYLGNFSGKKDKVKQPVVEQTKYENPITNLAAHKVVDKDHSQIISEPTNNNYSQQPVKRRPTVLTPADNIVDPLAYQKESLFKNLQVKFEEIKMDANEGGTFKTKVSKSNVYFPGGIVQHEDGSPVEGEIIIKYREWRDAADMMFADIPMKVKENGEELNMNSAGMIEIRAYQNGEELKIGKEKSFTIDMNVTSVLDECYFWSLDDKTKEWEKLHQLNFTASTNNNFDRGYKGERLGYFNDSLIEEDYNYGYVYGEITSAYSSSNLTQYPETYSVKFISKEMKGTKFAVIQTDTGYILPQLKEGKYMVVASAPGYRSYTMDNVDVDINKFTILDFKLIPEKKRNKHIYNIFGKGNRERRAFNRNIREVNAGASLTNNKEIPQQYKRIQVDFVEGKDALTPVIKSDNLNGEIYRPKSLENYSKLVQGLQCFGFGVYNCDQVKRINNPVKVRPSFTGTFDNDRPLKTNYLVLIDRNLNASFSFYNDQITCEKDGINLLFIYSENKIYGVDEIAFKTGMLNPQSNFSLTDITDKIQSIDDLKTYLKL